MNVIRKLALPAILAATLLGTALWLSLGKNDPPDPPGDGPVEQNGWEWAEYRDVSLPSSAADGPYETDDGLAHGFSHTKTGALLAGAHIMARARAEAGPAVYEPTITGQTTGAGRDVMLRDVRYQYGQTGEEPLGPEVKLVGYRFLAFDPEKATYELLVSPEGDSTSYSANLEVQWDGNDWRLVIPESGGWQPTVPDALTLKDFELFTGGR